MSKYTLFVYGTLQNSVIRRSLLGKVSKTRVAILSGFSVHSLCGEEYPAVRPRRGASVRGLIVLGLTARDLDRLDHYEGHEYTRMRVQTILEGTHSKMPAYVYCLKPSLYSRINKTIEDTRQYASLPQYKRAQLLKRTREG